MRRARGDRAGNGDADRAWVLAFMSSSFSRAGQ
jgi:hypothetical protein